MNEATSVEYSFDFGLYNELRHLFQTNGAVQQCHGILESFLLQDLRVDGATPALERYLRDHVLPFFRSVLRGTLLVGWCAYRLVRIKDAESGKSIKVPRVVPFEFLDCTMRYDYAKASYTTSFSIGGSFEEAKDVRVLTRYDMGHFMTPGMCYSPVRNLLSEFRYVQQLKKFSIQSEFVRSNPPVFLREDKVQVTESHMAATVGAFTGGSTEGRTVSLAADGPEDFFVKPTPVSKRMENASRDMATNIAFHQEELADLASNQQSNYFNLGLGFTPQWYNNLFICPPSMVLAAPPQMPESRLDQLAFERNLSSLVYMMFGIPEAMIGNLASTNASMRGSISRAASVRNQVNIMDVNHFESTLLGYVHFFRSALREVYVQAFKAPLDPQRIHIDAPPLYTSYISHIFAANEAAEQPDAKRAKIYEAEPDSTAEAFDGDEPGSERVGARELPGGGARQRDDAPPEAPA